MFSIIDSLRPSYEIKDTVAIDPLKFTKCGTIILVRENPKYSFYMLGLVIRMSKLNSF